MSALVSENGYRGEVSVTGGRTTAAVETVDSAPEILLLGASFTTSNLGVSALASGAITAALNTWPDATIRLLDYGRQPDRHDVEVAGKSVVVETVNLRFSKSILLPNNIARLIVTALVRRLIPFNRSAAQRSSSNQYLSCIQQADIIGAISGGDSFSDIYGLGRLVYVALPQLLVLLLEKPLVLLPQTIGPFRGFWAKLIAKFILRRACRVYGRDDESLAVVKGLAPQQTAVERTYDIGVALQPRAAPAVAAELDALSRPLVGLNVSGLLWKGGYDGNNMFGLQANYRSLMHELIGRLASRGCLVLLVPHVFGPGAEGESDALAGENLFGELDRDVRARVEVIKPEYDQHEIKYIIGQCDFMVGSRMHACIAALSQGIPAVGLAYSRKFDGVFRTFGVGELVVDLSLQTTEAALERVMEVFGKRERLQESLKITMPAIRQTALGLFGRIGQDRGWEVGATDRVQAQL